MCHHVDRTRRFTTMLTANKISTRGFRKAVQFEVKALDSPVGIINDTDSTFHLDNQHYNLVRSGVLAPKFELKCGETVIATAQSEPFRNYYRLTLGGTELTFKATNLLATEFGLFENETQTGKLLSGPWINRLKNITADLPEEVPQEIQLFLLAIFIGVLTKPD